MGNYVFLAPDMKKWLFICLLSGGFIAPELFAQKRGDNIKYYTDYEVKRSPVSIGVNYSPYLAMSRELRDDLGDVYTYMNDGAKGRFRFGQSYGGDLYIDLNQSFDLVLGINRSVTNFVVDLNRFHSPEMTDTLTGNLRLSSRVTHLNIPIHIMLKANLSDELSMEFLPQLEFNIPQGYEQEVGEGGNMLFSRDVMEFTRKYTYTLGMGAGVNYRFAEYFSYFIRANFRYMLPPMVEQRGYARENMYTFGIYTGLRFYFSP
jgi:hypothetical protein